MHFGLRVDEEIELRLPEPRHAEEMLALINRNREHLERWLPWVDHIREVADERAFIDRSLRDFAAGKSVTVNIVYHGELVGGLGTLSIRVAAQSVEMGYWLSTHAEGKGIMTRACRAMLDYLLVERKLNRVEMLVQPGNARSCAIPLRLGFQLEGTLREVARQGDRRVDVQLYSMLAREWKARRSEA